MRAARLVALALLAAACTSAAPEREAGGELLHSAWRLVDLGGARALEEAEATLEFPEPGRAAGRGTCNRFFATVTVAGDAIRFGPIGATRMACAEPLAGQESRYLKLLENAERFAIEGDALAIYAKGAAAPLRFERTGTSSRP